MIARLRKQCVTAYHTYIHTYIHKYIHIYIHTPVVVSECQQKYYMVVLGENDLLSRPSLIYLEC